MEIPDVKSLLGKKEITVAFTATSSFLEAIRYVRYIWWWFTEKYSPCRHQNFSRNFL